MEYHEAVARILAQGEAAMSDFRAENRQIDKSFRDGAMTKHVEEILNDNSSTLDEETRRYLSRRAGRDDRRSPEDAEAERTAGEEATGHDTGQRN